MVALVSSRCVDAVLLTDGRFAISVHSGFFRHHATAHLTDYSIAYT